MRDIIQESMTEPKREQGAPIPLFEKLCNDDLAMDSEIPPKRYYNRLELIQSIQDELSRILNTRANAKKGDYDLMADEPMNFGLPQMYGLADFSQYDAASQSSYPRIARLCESAIKMYEPRLKDPVVTITSFNSKTAKLSAIIEAELNVTNFQGEVTFPLDIEI